MVTPWCKICSCRRDAKKQGGVECADKNGHKKSVWWQADVHFERGVENRRRKLFRTKEDALKQERQWETDHDRDELGPRKKDAVVTFGEVADKYWHEHSKIENRNPEETTYYRVELLKAHIGKDRKTSPLSEIEMIAFQNELRQLQRTLRKDRAGATVNRIFNVLRSIFERNKMWGVIKQNPCDLIERVQEDEPLPRFLDVPEIEKLRRAVENLPAYALKKGLPPITPVQIHRLKIRMTVYLHTGARPSSQEECNWDNGDVDLEQRVIWFTTYKGGKKQKKHRYPHPIDKELYAILMERAQVTGKKGLVFDSTGLRELEVLAVEASGVNEGKSEKQLFTMYGLKHCYASHLLMSGASESEVAKLLGHTDTRMVHKHYGHLTLGHLRKVQERVNLTPPLWDILKPDDDMRAQGNQN